MDLRSLFDGLNVGDLFPYRKEIFTFNSNGTVAEFINKLEEFNILSAPIVNDSNQIIGICDMLDIVLFVIGLFPKELPQENLDENELRKVMKTGGVFESSPVSDVLILSSKIKTNYRHVFTVRTTTPVSKLLEMFYQGVHRVLVIEDSIKNSVINIISQSDLLSILAQCLPYLEEKEKKRNVKDLYLATSSGDLISANAETKTLSVLLRMQPDINKPILSAVPIVDNEGHLIANFSASNLKGLRQHTFMSLLLPVLAYLTIQPESKDFRRNLSRFKSIHPVTCTPDTTFEVAVERMVSHRVHRLWVVEDGKPIGVVSIGDVFKVFLPWASQ